MLEIKDKCNGCRACYSVCPKGAITMQEDKEGFLAPIINEEKCVNCGLCEKVCKSFYDKNYTEPKCYAVMAEDLIRLSGSSSGAVFPVIAKKIIEKGGYVCGAAYNKNWEVEHIIINDLSDLDKLRGSKYVQSNIGECQKQIKVLLEDNKFVFFTGTPCQVGGLRNFLNKDYPNLLCADIICHGTPSPKVLRKYLDENFDKERIASINHRSKIMEWENLYTTIDFSNKELLSEKSHENPYLRAFLYNLSIRKSCFDCKYQTFPRQGDITMGDFWGVSDYNPEYNDKLGTSVLLINNQKAEKFISEIKNSFKLFKETPLEAALKMNPNLTKSTKPHKNRDLFFNYLDKMTLKENLEYTFNEKADCILLNLWFCVNYGALLTCYGLKKFLENNGIKTKVANYVHGKFRTMAKDYFPMEFAEKYLSLTEPCANFEDLKKLNNQTETFMVGSDQLWKSSIYKDHGGYIYHLNFADGNKRKIAYSVSFGDDKFDGNYEDAILSKHYLKRFDNISVRENGGLNILKNQFDLSGVQLLDPVFAITKEEWEKIGNIENNDGDYIAYYSLACGWYNDDVPYIKKVVSYAEKKLKMKSISIRINKKYSVEKWISYIRNCKFFITDSYHGVCFAIIFNKPFIFINNNRGGNDRFTTLFDILKINNRTIYHNDDFTGKEYLFDNIDYNPIIEIINKERERSKKWLLEAMSTPIKKIDENTELVNVLLNKEFDFTNKTSVVEPKKKLTVLQKIFSITNVKGKGGKKYKMIAILGLKIKIRK